MVGRSNGSLGGAEFPRVADHAGGLAGLPAGGEAPRRLEVRERGRDREAEEGLKRDGEDGDQE
jgi:hypothetical protein